MRISMFVLMLVGMLSGCGSFGENKEIAAARVQQDKDIAKAEKEREAFKYLAKIQQDAIDNAKKDEEKRSKR